MAGRPGLSGRKLAGGLWGGLGCSGVQSGCAVSRLGIGLVGRYETHTEGSETVSSKNRLTIGKQ